MIKFRGTTSDGKVVEGYYFKLKDEHCILAEDAELIDGYEEVLPSSLAMSADIKDKNEVEIFGSYPVDGVETKGGDRVIHDNGQRPSGFFDVVWDIQKKGWVLTGFGEDNEFWLREWYKEHVEVIPKETE